MLGAAAVDWVARLESLPPPDGLSFAESYQAYPGGSGGNLAEGLARLGHGVRFLGTLGDDEGCRLLLEAFRTAGVDTAAILIEAGERSAACFIAVDAHGQRQIYALGGAAVYTRPAQLRPEWLKGARTLVVTDAYPEVALAAADTLETGATLVLNPGGWLVSQGEQALAPLLERSAALVLSRGEAVRLTGQPEEILAARRLARLGPPVVLLTLGGEGVLLQAGGRSRRLPAFPVDRAADTTGAGDAFTAGLVSGRLRGLDWESAARLGCAAAAIKIRHFGSRSGLPDRAQVEALVRTISSEEEVMP